MRQVFFHIENFDNDLIIEINGNPCDELVPAEFALDNLGDFWVRRNTAGDFVLCGEVSTLSHLMLTMRTQNQQTYIVNGCDFIGGRPPVTR